MEIEKEKYKLTEADLFECAEARLKISPMSQGSALQEAILEDSIGCRKVASEAHELEVEINRLRILAKALKVECKASEKVLTEADTRRRLIDPIVNILSKFSTKVFTDEEWSMHNNVYDYIIKGKNPNTGVVIEAKRQGLNLLAVKKNDIKSVYRGQVAKYLYSTTDVDGFSTVLLMNGYQIAVFINCSIDGKYQPMRDATKPIFYMHYDNVSFDKCVILCYIIKYGLSDHTRIRNLITQVFNRDFTNLKREVKNMGEIVYGK